MVSADELDETQDNNAAEKEVETSETESTEIGAMDTSNGQSLEKMNDTSNAYAVSALGGKRNLNDEIAVSLEDLENDLVKKGVTERGTCVAVSAGTAASEHGTASLRELEDAAFDEISTLKRPDLNMQEYADTRGNTSRESETVEQQSEYDHDAAIPPPTSPPVRLSSASSVLKNRTPVENGDEPGAYPVEGRASGERPRWELMGDISTSNTLDVSDLGTRGLDATENALDLSENDALSHPTENVSSDFFSTATGSAYLVEAEAVEEGESPVLVRAKPETWWRQNQSWIAAIGVSLFLGIALPLTLGLTVSKEQNSVTPSPTIIEQGTKENIIGSLSSYYESSYPSFAAMSPQSQALDFLVESVLNDDNGWYTDDRVVQQYSLLTLFFSTSEGGTESSTWLRHDGWITESDECDWFGVTCEDGSVIHLELNDNNLEGTLPLEVAFISRSLSKLDMKGNKLIGTIPDDIGKISKLTELNLSQNNLVGTIPTCIGKLTHLISLNLSKNKILSRIPSEIGALERLQHLSFANNFITGSLPSEIGDLSETREIYMQNNHITYTIPSEVGKMTLLEHLSFQGNDLLGPLPSEISQLRKLRSMNLGKNHIFDQVPKEFWQEGNLQSLEILDLSSNLLTGTLSPEFGRSWQRLTSLRLGRNFLQRKLPALNGAALYSKMPRLQQLDLSFNYFTGTLPTGVLQLNKLTSLELDGNQLEGTLPDKLFEMTNLRSLELRSNKFTGTVPTSLYGMLQLETLGLGKNSNNKKSLIFGTFPPAIKNLVALKNLDLTSSMVSGSLPSLVGEMTLLQSLVLNDNQITGTIPFEIGLLPELSDLNITSNFISGTLPTSLGNLTNLEIMDFKDNHLTGRIPTEVGILSNLQYLNLMDNKVTGNLPSEIGNLESLWLFKVAGNSINETLPTEIGKLTNLEVLNLSQNDLRGMLPTEIGQLQSLTKVVINFNAFTGPIPSEVGLLTNLSWLWASFNDFSGLLPSELGAISGIEEFSLNNNRFTGAVPNELKNLSSLSFLFLEDTYLTGSLPHELCDIFPIPDIRVDCEDVECHCCNRCEHLPTSPPTISFAPSQTPMPSALRSESPSLGPTISPSPSLLPSISAKPTRSTSPTMEGSYCSLFTPISDLGSTSRLGLQSDGTKLIKLPFPFKWEGDKEYYEQIIVDNTGGISVGDGSDDCKRRIVSAYLFDKKGYRGSIYKSSNNKDYILISWEDVIPLDDINSSFRVNFQVVLYADGRIEMRWGTGFYPTSHQMAAFLYGDCPSRLERAFLGPGRTEFGEWPTNQCRMFLPDASGFYN